MTIFTNDIELVKRLRKGDIEAFDMIYEKYSGKLYMFGLKYLRSSDDAKELVQSVFLKVWENHKRLKEELSFKSFLFTIAYNDICKIFRRRNYHQKFILETIIENNEVSLEVDERINFQSILERVQKIISTLPERQKTILFKSREEGKSTKEIAAELNLSPGTVDNYISETIKVIRKKLRSENLTLLLFFSLYFL
jgi:RNA polymerase sigma-70 factor (family 1)